MMLRPLSALTATFLMATGANADVGLTCIASLENGKAVAIQISGDTGTISGEDISKYELYCAPIDAGYLCSSTKIDGNVSHTIRLVNRGSDGWLLQFSLFIPNSPKAIPPNKHQATYSEMIVACVNL
ncbi:hypothetical protein [Pseudogemmobacter bohemicus]|uniref:hypothetical protein n=1 Tax=Pseudogemmobacter bohemicus TaxID=2250708 RepID=UPI0013002A35|nr:hypothetical protein [Pseudogemmobacter bohemicus]